MNKTALVTGGSSGIGREVARLLSQNGYDVFELSRRDIPQDGVRHITADITNPTAVREAVAEVLTECGRLDLVVNNAGAGISGAVEFTDDNAVMSQLSILFCGMDIVCRACLPHLRVTGGRIVNVSSAAAVLPIPFQTYYSAMKSAVNAYTMALAGEVRGFGVTVCAVMPGDTKTGFTSARKRITAGDDIYGGAISRSVGRMERDEQSGDTPQKVANAIVKAATRRRVKPLYAVGAKYKLFCLLSKLLPARMVNAIIASLYA